MRDQFPSCFTHLKILSGQATSFDSLFGGGKHIVFAFGIKVNSRILCQLSLDSIPVMTREVVNSCRWHRYSPSILVN